LRPWRGGIARHSTRLAAALRREGPLETVSFRRLYPGWLYPGQTLAEPGFDAAWRAPGARYDLDAFGPASWRRLLRGLAGQPLRGAILPWWTAALAPCWGFLARRLRRHGPVLLLCHNLVDHEAAWWKRMLTRRVLRQASALVVQAQSEVAAAQALAPGVSVHVYPHPAWDEPLGVAALPALPRRGRLELLFFGFVRPYKGLDVLVSALEQVGSAEVALTVAGEWWRTDAPLRRRLAALPNTTVIDRYVTAAEADACYARADVVLLPYRSASGSGVAADAFRHAKPVLASRVGALADMVQDGGNGWLVPPADAAALAAAIRRLLRTPPARPPSVATGVSWRGLARCLLDALDGRSTPAVPAATGSPCTAQPQEATP
jgi:glycosyltransferase involved in cell wall biosynthesis